MLTSWKYISTQSKQPPFQTAASLCVNALLGSRLWDEGGIETVRCRRILVAQPCAASSHATLAAAGNHTWGNHLTQLCVPECEQGCCRKGEIFCPLHMESLGSLLLEPGLPQPSP